MKLKYILTALLAFTLYGNAQQTYTVNAVGAISPAVTQTVFTSIIFKIDKAFKDKTFEIYSADGSDAVTLIGQKLDSPLLPKDADGNYTITIKENHKIKECGDEDCNDVTNDFSVKLNGKVLGVFHLTAATASGITTTTAPTKVYQGGSVINDALYIAENIKEKTNPIVVEAILEKYAISTSAELKKNLFLNDAIKIELFTKAQGPENKVNIKNIAGSVGGLDVTTIADGFAKFIVKRTKQELSIAFFEKFKDNLEKYPDLKTLFPETYNLLQAIDQQIYNYNNYIGNLREAFKADLQSVDEKMPVVIDNHPRFFEKRYELALALKTAFYVSSSLKQELHPGTIIKEYPIPLFDAVPDDYPQAGKEKLKAIKGSIQTIQLFSESLKETDSTKGYWVGYDKVRKMVNNQEALKIYIGLLLQVAKQDYDEIKFTDAVSFYGTINKKEVIDTFKTDYPAYWSYFSNLGDKVSELNKMIKEYKVMPEDSLKVEKFAEYFIKSIELTQYAVKTGKLPHLKEIKALKNLESSTQRYFTIAHETANLAIAINRKKYAETINHLVIIYNQALADIKPEASTDTSTPPDTGKKEKAAKTNVPEANETPSPLVATEDKEATLAENSATLSLMAKYGAFMASVVTAKNSDEVEQAIESVALPPGSSRIKRESDFNVSLNAYCGLFLGGENIKGFDNGYKGTVGITAPIGVSISWGKAFGGHSSNSLFFSFVDLGAVTAFRFNDDKTEAVPKIELKDIVSPGIFYSIGIPNYPISFNIGYQIGPLLRKVDADVNTYQKSYTRMSIGIVVDIPLLNLYTKSK